MALVPHSHTFELIEITWRRYIGNRRMLIFVIQQQVLPKKLHSGHQTRTLIRFLFFYLSLLHFVCFFFFFFLLSMQPFSLAIPPTRNDNQSDSFLLSYGFLGIYRDSKMILKLNSCIHIFVCLFGSCFLFFSLLVLLF